MACWVCSPLGARAPEKSRGEFRANRAVFPRGADTSRIISSSEGVRSICSGVGVANDTQVGGNRTAKKAFGHATSTDLVRGGITRASSELFRYVGGAGRIRSIHRKARNVLHVVYTGSTTVGWSSKPRSGYQQRSVRLETLSGKSGLYTAPEVGDAQSDRLGGLPGFAHPAIWRAVPDVSMVTTADGKGRDRSLRRTMRSVGKTSGRR